MLDTLLAGGSAYAGGLDWIAAPGSEAEPGDTTLLRLLASFRDTGAAAQPQPSFRPERISGYCAS